MHRPSYSLNIVSFFSATAAQNLMKSYRKQVFRVFSLCFSADWSSNMAAGGSDWLFFDIQFPLQPLHKISQNLTGQGCKICEISWSYGLPNLGAQKQILGPTKLEKVVNNPLNEEIQFHINF